MRRLYLFPLLFFSSISWSQAQPLVFSTSKTTITIGEEVEFTINSSSPPSYCGIRVNYLGTTEPQTLIRINHQGSTFPYTFKKAFSAPGTIQIVAKGEKVSSALGCVGQASTTITVAAPTPLASNSSTSANALSELKAKAQAGDLDGMYALGNLLAHNKENGEALKWFMAAAKRNHAKAMNSVGFMHEEGRGTLQDHKEAAEWYARAALRGNADAMVNRGILLFKGLGVPANKSQAYAHFSLATVHATDTALRDEALKLRDEAAKQMNPNQLTAAQAEAKRMAGQIKN